METGSGSFFFLLDLQPNVGYGLLVQQITRTHNDGLHSVGLLLTLKQLVAETCT